MSQNGRSSPSADSSITHPQELLTLVLQGGGALGAYQAGAFEALDAAGARPDWVAGISIGAINAALIAGNPAEKRVEALRTFWEEVSSNFPFPFPSANDDFRSAFNETSAATTMLFGAPGFFRPRILPAYFAPERSPDKLGVYDTGPLRETLEKLVDFDRLNSGDMRLSVGAVNVVSGNFRYFDTQDTRIGPQHIMASGALPPGFPPVEIDGEWFWDGGLVSNTPLQYILDRDERAHDMCIFQVDLFSSRGSMPNSFFDLGERAKDIRYSSRTRLNTDLIRNQQRERRAVHRLLEKLPDSLDDDPDVRMLREMSNDASVTIVHLINKQRAYASDSKDYEFSRNTIEERWSTGYADTRKTLECDRFRNRSKPRHTITVLDLCEEELGGEDAV